MAESKRFFTGPAAVLVDLLNPIALAGWSYVAYLVATSPPPHEAAIQPSLALELICFVEVLRMVLSDLPGNLVLGAVLHSIRLLALTVILPRTDPANAWLATAVLGAWAATEVSRYPMYVVKGMGVARLLRMVVPMVTFPIGCGAEAYSAYLVFGQPGTTPVLKGALGLMIAVNALLGPTLAYPVIMTKGLQEMGIIKTKPKPKPKPKTT